MKVGTNSDLLQLVLCSAISHLWKIVIVLFLLSNFDAFHLYLV